MDMRTVSIIIQQQPELTPYLKEKTDRFIESLVTLYGDVEFLFSEKGEYETYLLSSVDKVRKEKKFSERNVVVTWVSNDSLAECRANGFFFDRILYVDREKEGDPLSLVHFHMIDRSDILLYYVGIFNRNSEDLVQYAKYCDRLSLNLADMNDTSCISHKER